MEEKKSKAGDRADYPNKSITSGGAEHSVRLQKHIADMGICSRRAAEKLIADGNVRVNGRVITELGTKINPTNDRVEVIGAQNKTQKNTEPVYIALNKPVDYITSTTDTQGISIMELLTPDRQIGRNKIPLNARVYPVGRLDKDSEGLVLLTNNGELANQLTHPKFEHEKEYEVTIDTPLTRDAKKVLASGMNIGTPAAPERVRGLDIIHEKNLGRRTVVTVTLREGKNRQLRKMFGRLGYTISTLRRIKIGKLALGTLPVGKWKYITKKQII